MKSAASCSRRIRSAQVEKLLAAKGKHEQLAFVGDGINDAPVLHARRHRHRDGRHGQ